MGNVHFTIYDYYLYSLNHAYIGSTFQISSTSELFFPRCMECQRGLVTRKLSVRPSVRLFVMSTAWIVTKRIFIPYENSFSLVF